MKIKKTEVVKDSNNFEVLSLKELSQSNIEIKLNQKDIIEIIASENFNKYEKLIIKYKNDKVRTALDVDYTEELDKEKRKFAMEISEHLGTKVDVDNIVVNNKMPKLDEYYSLTYDSINISNHKYGHSFNISLIKAMTVGLMKEGKSRDFTLVYNSQENKILSNDVTIMQETVFDKNICIYKTHKEEDVFKLIDEYSAECREIAKIFNLESYNNTRTINIADMTRDSRIILNKNLIELSGTPLKSILESKYDIKF